MRVSYLALWIIVGSLVVGCGPDKIEEPTHPSLIVALVDTLRADHTSLHGYVRPTTPFLKELARESVVFERARSQAGCTYPSVNSMLTSRYAFEFYRRGSESLGIPGDLPSMAEFFKAQGYATVAVSASPIVRATPSSHNPGGGFGAGFDVFDETCLWKPAECVNQRAREILQNLEEPFFLYLHYMDPHDFYQAPHGHRRFAGDYEGFDFIAAGNPNPIGEMIYDHGPLIEYTDADIQHLVDLYDDEIHYFDDRFRAFISDLENLGILDRAMLVLTSDHGEEFLEHGHIKHCRGVWDTLTHVPFLLRFPGGGGPQQVQGTVQLVDILPTVLDYLGIPFDASEMAGISLRSIIEGTDVRARYAFSDQSKYRGVHDGRHHLILDGSDTTMALFDTDNDPLELENIFAAGHPQCEGLSAELDLWLEETGQRLRFDAALEASKAQEEQLRALGYLE